MRYKKREVISIVWHYTETKIAIYSFASPILSHIMEIRIYISYFMSPSFIVRQAELGQLLELTKKSTASFVVVKVGRRTGKIRLIQEFGKHYIYWN